MIVNLVGNAIKFTEEGEVVMTVMVEDQDEADLRLRFVVADTGIGIEPAKLEAIFEPFEQADPSTTRRYGGTGLGLAISSRLVEMMEGRLWAESQPGRGSQFGFTVALGRESKDETEARVGGARPVLELPGLDELPILVVDDNATNRLILEEILSSWGARPAAVNGSAPALEALRQSECQGRPFAAALVNGMMPDVNGLDLIRLIRGEPVPAVASIPVLLLTSAGACDATQACGDLRIGACLTKPVRQSDLFDALMKALPAAGAGPYRGGRSLGLARCRPRRAATRARRPETEHPARRGPSGQSEGRRADARAPGPLGRRGPGRAPGARAPWIPPSSTSCSWTCRCPRWTASKPSARSARPRPPLLATACRSSP